MFPPCTKSPDGRHNFQMAGGNCLNGCGMNQRELSHPTRAPVQERDPFADALNKKPLKTIHTDIHLLAKDLSELCGEPKKFGLYLGVLKRKGAQWGWTTLSEMKDGMRRGQIKNPGKLFMWKSTK